MITGQCLCRAIRFSVNEPPFASDHCHCSVCRKVSGAPVMSWLDFKRSALTWHTEPPTEFASSEFVRRGFCNQCGTTLTYRDTRYSDYITLAIGALDEPAKYAPDHHIHCDSQLPWLSLSDALPRYAKGKV